MKNFILLIVLALMFSCGGNPEQKAADLVAKKNYSGAVNVYKKLINDNPDNAILYQSKAALYQLKYGYVVFNRLKKKNISSAISAYTTNYEKAMDILPDTPDKSVDHDLANEFMVFANVLHDAEAPNSVKADEWENMMMDLVDRAASIEPANKTVEKFKANVYTEKFDEAKKSGDTHYQTAIKKRSDIDYIDAEKSYMYALRFKPDDKETMEMLSKVRKKTLDMWNPDFDFMFGVAKIDFVGDNVWLIISIKNNTDLNMPFDPANFKLYDKSGNELTYNEAATQKEKNGFKAMTLKRLKDMDGLVAYEFKGKAADLGKLTYMMDNGTEETKYFP